MYITIKLFSQTFRVLQLPAKMHLNVSYKNKINQIFPLKLYFHYRTFAKKCLADICEIAFYNVTYITTLCFSLGKGTMLTLSKY